MRLYTVLALLLITAGFRAHAQTAFERGGNIFLKDKRGNLTQLTFSEHDSAPSLSPDGNLVSFVRMTSKKPIFTGNGGIDPTEIWVIDVRNKDSAKLVAPMEAKNMEDVLAGFSDLQFSNDSKTIFFLSNAWTTSAAVHKVNVRTREQSFVAPGNSLLVIREGKDKGNLKVNQHRYHDKGGSFDCDYILSPEGKIITRLKDSCD